MCMSIGAVKIMHYMLNKVLNHVLLQQPRASRYRSILAYAILHKSLQRLMDPHEEWPDTPLHMPPPKHVSNVGQQPAQPTGKWRTRTQELAKAVLDGDKELAIQLARMYWAGDPEVAGRR